MRAHGMLATLALGIALPLAASAADAVAPSAGDPPSWAYALAREIMSPFCPGRALSDCPSSEAQTLRAWILVQEAAGRSREDVEAELLQRYGEQILAAPRARGFGLTAWAIPIGVFVVGGGVVAFFLRRQTREARAAAPLRAAPLPPELERLVDEELGR